MMSDEDEVFWPLLARPLLAEVWRPGLSCREVARAGLGWAGLGWAKNLIIPTSSPQPALGGQHGI